MRILSGPLHFLLRALPAQKAHGVRRKEKLAAAPLRFGQAVAREGEGKRGRKREREREWGKDKGMFVCIYIHPSSYVSKYIAF